MQRGAVLSSNLTGAGMVAACTTVITRNKGSEMGVMGCGGELKRGARSSEDTPLCLYLVLLLT